MSVSHMVPTQQFFFGYGYYSFYLKKPARCCQC